MYGQTNCFILPDGDYIAVKNKLNEVWIMSEHSARNLSYQDAFESFGTFNVLFKLKGSDLIGSAVHAPLSKYDHVYVLPMNTIKMDKGTGIVTSVPSDSPDDYINFKELKDKDFYRKPYNIELDMLDREIVDIISIKVPDETNRSAEY